MIQRSDDGTAVHRRTHARPRDPGVAAVLSLLVPGFGQFYAGRWVWGIFWLIVTPGFWIGTGGLLGWVCHVLSAVQASRQVERGG